MGEHGVKFVKPELPEWKWKPTDCDRMIVNNPAYPGKGSRHERRKSLVELRQELKLEAKRSARRKSRDAKNAEEELCVNGN